VEKSFKLDGREFRGVSQSLTAAQDDYLLAHLRRCGAVEALTDIDGVQRSQENRAELLLTQIMLSGETFRVLAGCLTEVGKKWSREEAERNAAAFMEITDREEKLRIRAALVNFVIGFFVSGAKSSETSQKSSPRKKKDRTTESAEPGTSETSPPSSAS
jgi:hypothetical protein